MLELEPKLGKKRPELLEPESDLDDEFEERYLTSVAEKEAEKNVKALAKENEKRAESGQKPLTSLPTRAPPAQSMEKLEKKLATLNDRIGSQKMQFVDKDENKQTALGTSKINYIDPRISAAWCDRYEVPLDKIFNRSLREKFTWAMDTDASFVTVLLTKGILSILMLELLRIRYR